MVGGIVHRSRTLDRRTMVSERARFAHYARASIATMMPVPNGSVDPIPERTALVVGRIRIEGGIQRSVPAIGLVPQIRIYQVLHRLLVSLLFILWRILRVFQLLND